ncbi:GDSL-type esterase/lipase family protein [Sunxiuqinia sp. A32]|uniref:GDSL-type esterase/lipase family protein n=1 Tax=Sunxiuqinia sp. A32 TaxID=3461496 RepID=UPI0040459FDF
MTRIISYLILISLFVGCKVSEKDIPNIKPTVYIIGDSTVKNGRGDGAGGLWGWGDPLVQFFDTSKINIENHAMDETSSRTFRTMGLWDSILRNLQPGDYVIIQFGHNDDSPINDKLRARGTFDGISEKSEKIHNELTGALEVVHSYGWYLRQYIIEAKKKEAIPIVISPIPENEWENGKVLRNDTLYGEWAREVANFEEIEFVNLNEKMASAMEDMGADFVTGNYFLAHDEQHTTANGAVLAASMIAESIRESEDCYLKDYLLKSPEIHFPVKKNVFTIGDANVIGGSSETFGWGDELSEYLDTTRIHVSNCATIGANCRSYLADGVWDDVLSKFKEGDFLLIQYGYSENAELDKSKLLAPLPGAGNEVREVALEDGSKEIIHTYGWYMKNYITEAKAKGVNVILLSQVPENKWASQKDELMSSNYISWLREIAKNENVVFFDLNQAIALEYDVMGSNIVSQFYTNDDVHTNAKGAKLNALILAKEFKGLNSCALSGYVELKNK